MDAGVGELEGIALDDAVGVALVLMDRDDQLLEVALVDRLEAALAMPCDICIGMCFNLHNTHTTTKA